MSGTLPTNNPEGRAKRGWMLAALVLVSTVVSAAPPPSSAGGATRLRPGPDLATRPRFTPPPGPPPQQLHFDLSGTGGISVKLAWAPAPNAVRYIVSRSVEEDPACCNVTSPSLTETTWTDKRAVLHARYVYKVTAVYADLSEGTAQTDIFMPGAGLPGLIVQDMGPGQIRFIDRTPASASSGFVIKGPGVEAGKIVIGGMYDMPLLPSGNLTWKTAAFYGWPEDGYARPESEWTTVTHAVNYGHGRFRVSLEGFKAISVTAEDIFRADGRGDEVFITAQVNEYWRNGRLTSARMVRTPTFGDVENFPARRKAGSASPSGGIMPNDQYPPPVVYTKDLKPATTGNLPFLLWEGDLSEIDNSVVFSPAVWESDADDRLFPSFAAFHAALVNSVPWFPTISSYMIQTLRNAPPLDTWNPGRDCPSSTAPNSPATVFTANVPGWRDEPMDMKADHTYCPMYFAVNYRLAQTWTSTNFASVVVIPFVNPATGWKYILYVRIEKVS